MKIVFLALTVLLVITPMQTDCRNGLATRHDAWESVFSHFPDRLRSDVHGYIALQDCGEMGSIYTIRLGEKTYRVAVADCRNRSLAPRTDNWLVDLDGRLWWAADLPNKPVEVRLCKDRRER